MIRRILVRTVGKAALRLELQVSGGKYCLLPELFRFTVGKQLYALCVLAAERQAVAPHRYLYWVPHRRGFYYLYLGAGGDTHINYSSAAAAIAVHYAHVTLLPYRKICQCPAFFAHLRFLFPSQLVLSNSFVIMLLPTYAFVNN